MKAHYKKKKEKKRQKSRIKIESIPTTNFLSPARTNKGLLIFSALKLKKKRKKHTHQKFLSQVKK